MRNYNGHNHSEEIVYVLRALGADEKLTEWTKK